MRLKKGGAAIIKNMLSATLSLAFIIFNVACYLSIKGVFAGGNEFNGLYNGVYLWELVFTMPEYFSLSFQTDVGWALSELIPLFIFTISLINLFICIIGACAKRYGATYNLVSSSIICALSVALLFVPYINIVKGAAFCGVENTMTVPQYFAYINNPQYTTIYFAPAIGGAHLILSIIFGAMAIKSRAQKEAAK